MQKVIIHFLLPTAEIYPKVYHTCFFIVTYFAPLCLMVLAYIQICHKLWFQQVSNLDVFVFFLNWLFFLLLQRWCLQLLIEAHTFPNRYLETHQWCRGSGGPCSARLGVQPWQSPRGLEPVRFAPRSNRSEPGARRLACWWWCSLCLHSVICPSAPSISWKGNHPSCSRNHKVTQKSTMLCYKHVFFLILSDLLHVEKHSQRKG